MYLIFGRKTIAAVLAAVVVITAVAISGRGIYDHEAVMSAAQDNWGLSFQTEGAAPVGNASAQELKKLGAYYVGDTSQKKIFLTFDAGYENGYTEKILDTLKKHGVKAAFFLVGNYIESSPELVKRMISEGHTVGNHTYSHPDMSAISDESSFADELGKNEAAFEKVTGSPMPKFYRPPQGKYSESNLLMAQKMGYTTFFWSLAYVDWYNDDQPTREEAFGKLIPRMHNGAIILLHSTSRTNSEILDELLTKLEAEGYKFGELSELTA